MPDRRIPLQRVLRTLRNATSGRGPAAGGACLARVPGEGLRCAGCTGLPA